MAHKQKNVLVYARMSAVTANVVVSQPAWLKWLSMHWCWNSGQGLKKPRSLAPAEAWQILHRVLQWLWMTTKFQFVKLADIGTQLLLVSAVSTSSEQVFYMCRTRLTEKWHMLLDSIKSRKTSFTEALLECYSVTLMLPVFSAHLHVETSSCYPSLRPSVCLSNACIVTRRNNSLSILQHHTTQRCF